MKKLLLLVALVVGFISCQKDDYSDKSEVLNIDEISGVDINYEKEQLQLAQERFDDAQSNSGKTTKRFPTSHIERGVTTGARWDAQVWLNAYGLHYGDNRTNLDFKSDTDWYRSSGYLFYPQHNTGLSRRIALFSDLEETNTYLMWSAKDGAVAPKTWTFYEDNITGNIYEVNLDNYIEVALRYNWNFDRFNSLYEKFPGDEFYTEYQRRETPEGRIDVLIDESVVGPDIEYTIISDNTELSFSSFYPNNEDNFYAGPGTLYFVEYDLFFVTVIQSGQGLFYSIYNGDGTTTSRGGIIRNFSSNDNFLHVDNLLFEDNEQGNVDFYNYITQGIVPPSTASTGEQLEALLNHTTQNIFVGDYLLTLDSYGGSGHSVFYSLSLNGIDIPEFRLQWDFSGVADFFNMLNGEDRPDLTGQDIIDYINSLD